ncbi:MAG: hypothetical protein QF864_04785 [SAR202 cluster bacterium]|nr:hypothetical protein [SAR202 cluster bacterium]|tara:strand:- start:5 stop:583 length:579 start_codon:yes stop_codon:yes gene_type:complete
MKKLLSIIILGLLWCNVVSADPKWNFVENDNSVRVEINGETTFGDKFTYALIKENGKCDNMIIYFSSISNGKYDLNKKILGLTIPVKINGAGPVEALIVRATSAFENVENAALDLTQEQIDRLKKTQMVLIQIGGERPINEYDFEGVAKRITIDLVKVDEFDPSEYFLNLSNTWDLSKNRSAVDVGLGMCKL